MSDSNRQAFNLKRWDKKKKKPTDPQYTGRGTLKPGVAAYIAECVEEGIAPELFLSAWLDPINNSIAFGLAVPYEYVTSKNVPDPTDIFE